jgi:Domain of unknown function (DUF1844)
MEESEEKERGFKVQDRRRFSAEGEAKPGTEDTTANKFDQPELKPGPASEPNASATAASAASPKSSPDAGSGPVLEINFATFLVGLSSEALAALGEIPDPSSHERRRDLASAQQLIDVIGMLQEKTRGNLDSHEQNLIEAILFDLRMKYVELAGQQAR